jgi:beta-glucosidase
MISAQQGVDELSYYERMVEFVKCGNQAGCIMFDAEHDCEEMLTEALQKGDITREQLQSAAQARAKVQILTTNMDNPYRDLEEAKATIAEVDPQIAALAELTHLKSVVLMKNSNNVLPLKDTGKKVYVAGFNQRGNQNMDGMIAELQAAGFTVVEDYNEADIAYMFVNPTIVGQGSNQLAILDLAEGVDTPIYDDNAKRTEETASVTTVMDIKNFKKVADAVHANGGIVIGNIEASNAWILSNMEPYCDGLIGTFSTSNAAIVDVLTGEYNPTGKLPITMVADASVIALVETTLGDGETWDICVSPNDVPGYMKDQYMSADVLAASPSGSYAYKDSEGNFYRSGHGLSYGE